MCGRARVLVALLVVGAALAQGYDDCPETDSGGVACNKTQYHGRCGTLYEPRQENWCNYRGTDICCGSSVDDCCADSQAATIGAIIILSLLCLCCFSMVCCKRLLMVLEAHALAQPRAGQPAPAPEVPSPQAQENERQAIALEQRVLAQLCQGIDPEGSDDDDVKECVVCMSGKRNVVLPCGHALLCKECAENVLRSRNKQCPTCRKVFHVFQCVENRPLPSYRDMSQFFENPALLPPVNDSGPPRAARRSRSQSNNNSNSNNSSSNSSSNSNAGDAEAPQSDQPEMELTPQGTRRDDASVEL